MWSNELIDKDDLAGFLLRFVIRGTFSQVRGSKMVAMPVFSVGFEVEVGS